MGERVVFPGAVWDAAALAGVLLERGQVAEAAEVIARSPHDLRNGWGVLSLLQVRARVRFALQQPMDALADLAACGRLEDELEIRTPSNTSWRAEAALVLGSLGRQDEAARLAHEELERSRRYGALRPLGIALRALGTLSRGPEGLELLAEAVDVHGRSQARLEHGRSLVELGTALRRAGRRREARDPLRTGMELALQCGAQALAARAHDELVAAGARPRRDPIESLSTLTAGEFRVARLAAEGLTNRQIAQSLFLTEKTIEVHLTHAYRKLEIQSRSQLARALPDAEIHA
jgi:DNA-binding CsgD family transcriptional regulator